MSIRATVGTILPSGLLQVIFVESGGLPSRLGGVLERNFREQRKVEALLNLGDTSEVVDSLTLSADYSLAERLDLGDFDGEMSEHVPELHFYEDIELWLRDSKYRSFAYLYERNQWKTYSQIRSLRNTLTSEGEGEPKIFLCHWVDENQRRVSKSFELIFYPIIVAGSDGNLPSD